MSAEVNIQIHSKTTYENGEIEQISYDTIGQAYKKDNYYFLRYKEDTQLQLGNTWTIVKWTMEEEQNEVVIIRQGDTKMKQVFKEGFTHQSNYQSQYGVLYMETVTNKIDIQLKTLFKGKINLKYELQIDNQTVGAYDLTIITH